MRKRIGSEQAATQVRGCPVRDEISGFTTCAGEHPISPGRTQGFKFSPLDSYMGNRPGRRP